MVVCFLLDIPCNNYSVGGIDKLRGLIIFRVHSLDVFVDLLDFRIDRTLIEVYIGSGGFSGNVISDACSAQVSGMLYARDLTD